jgi:hypothetical protein
VRALGEQLPQFGVVHARRVVRTRGGVLGDCDMEQVHRECVGNVNHGRNEKSRREKAQSAEHRVDSTGPLAGRARVCGQAGRTHPRGIRAGHEAAMCRRGASIGRRQRGDGAVCLCLGAADRPG